ncbi:hypothetical protein NL533_36340, partial [Klebsiella pneumoniae]|nr:hypothetical protein [Klebsiella pneumoniae]
MHPDVTFFRVRPSNLAAASLSGEKAARSVRTSTIALQLRNSFARGAATFLDAEPTLPLSVQWDNGLLATNQR